MNAALKEWSVLPHGKLTAIEDNILTVTGDLPMTLMDLPRRMTVVRLNDGRLVIYSAIALDEAEMASLENYGQPAFLVVPNDRHRRDAKIWKDRYPFMQVVTPSGARDRVEEVVPVDTVAPDFGDPHVEFITVPGTRGHESALRVRSASGTTLVLNDIVSNIRGSKGFGGWLLRLGGFAGDEAQIPKLVKGVVIADTQALRAQLQTWAQIDSLKRIVVSHGAIIDEHPHQTLLELANSLAD